MNTEYKIGTAMNKLVDFCKSGSNTTTIIGRSNMIIHAVKDNIGDSCIVYGIWGYSDQNFFLSVTGEMKVIALYANETVYIVDDHIFEVYSMERENIALPDGCVRYYDYCRELTEELNEYFSEYIESLEPSCINKFSENTLKHEARKEILGSGYNVIKMLSYSRLSDNNIVSILFGQEERSKVFHSVFEEAHNCYDDMKSLRVAIDKYLESNNPVENFERRIIKALNSIDAKTVTIEFEKNGIRAAEKINPAIIRSVILDSVDYFSGYRFITSKGGDELLKKLRVVDEYSHPERRLYPKDITRIIYRGKSIYER